MFYPSILSDWDCGSAHFLRGVVAELKARGHRVAVLEPEDAWSVRGLASECGRAPLATFAARYPHLVPTRYSLEELDMDRVLGGADVVIVHADNAPELVQRIGQYRNQSPTDFRLFFHDSANRIDASVQLDAHRLDGYDGALVPGAELAVEYERRQRVARSWVWHDAADTRVYRPCASSLEPAADVTFLGNWDSGERARDLAEFLLDPVEQLALRGTVYGSGYPRAAVERVERAGMRYGGWLPGFEVPGAFSRHRFTVSLPRRPRALPGICSVGLFEALACGIPLISAEWSDSEQLFTPGMDFLAVRNGTEMRAAMRMLACDGGARQALAVHGRRTIERRHTCAHRVDELLALCAELWRMEVSAALVE